MLFGLKVESGYDEGDKRSVESFGTVGRRHIVCARLESNSDATEVDLEEERVVVHNYQRLRFVITPHDCRDNEMAYAADIGDSHDESRTNITANGIGTSKRMATITPRYKNGKNICLPLVTSLPFIAWRLYPVPIPLPMVRIPLLS